MYTVKAIPNDGDVVNIVETHATYNDAKERALGLVHFMHKDAKVFTQSGILLFHITFNGEFEEKEYPMNPTRNKIVEIKAVRAVGDWGLREAKEFVEARTTEQVAMYVMENVYAATMDQRSKASQYDDLKASNDRYMQEAIAMRKVRYQLEKENKNLLNQRNTILAMLTKEQILDIYIASQSQTE